MVSKRIDKKIQEEIVKTGRERWKIENKGFNEQKIKDTLYSTYLVRITMR